MKRFALVFCGFALATSLVGCGDSNGTGGNGGTGDMVVAKVDMAGGGGDVDMAQMALLALTGEPCTKNSECQKGLKTGQNGTCRKTIGPAGMQVPWPSGFCTTECTADNDCPGVRDGLTDFEVVCGDTGECEVACATAADHCPAGGYACAYVGGDFATCLPAALSECNPAAAQDSCTAGTSCVSYSPDDTYGGCEQSCDVFAQGTCMPVNMVATVCIADPTNGKSNCIANSNSKAGDGAMCRFLNSCIAGFACHGETDAMNMPVSVCRAYCRTGANAVACPAGQTCKQLTDPPEAGTPATTVVGICGK